MLDEIPEPMVIASLRAGSGRHADESSAVRPNSSRTARGSSPCRHLAQKRANCPCRQLGALAHYLATFDALNRMRALLDRPPLHPFEEFPLERKPSFDELAVKKPIQGDKPQTSL